MSHAPIRLERGRALVFVGTQGCGKSLLARWIAAQHGTFLEVPVNKIDLGTFDFGEVLAFEPAVLVIDGDMDSCGPWWDARTLITNDECVCHQKGKEPRMVKTPLLIFCTSKEPSLPPEPPRFVVMRMGVTA